MTASPSRRRWLLLRDLQQQLPHTRGPMRRRTERAIAQLEQELAGGRGAAAEAQQRLDLEEAR